MDTIDNGLLEEILASDLNLRTNEKHEAAGKAWAHAIKRVQDSNFELDEAYKWIQGPPGRNYKEIWSGLAAPCYDHSQVEKELLRDDKNSVKKNIKST